MWFDLREEVKNKKTALQILEDHLVTLGLAQGMLAAASDFYDSVVQHKSGIKLSFKIVAEHVRFAYLALIPELKGRIEFFEGILREELAETCTRCFTCLDKPELGLAGNPTNHQMILCPCCGNKRCPKATYHKHACSNDNSPGQKGSRYANENG